MCYRVIRGWEIDSSYNRRFTCDYASSNYSVRQHLRCLANVGNFVNIQVVSLFMFVTCGILSDEKRL